VIEEDFFAMQQVTLYSDGSSRGNPGPGGYGTVLSYVDANGTEHIRELFAGYALTTNNRMEIMGVIAGLEALKHPCNVKVVSDSQYVVKTINEHWLDNWQAKGWKTANKKPVKNVDLWKRMIAAMAPHSVEFCWVHGHAGHPQNERCDFLATQAAQSDNLLIDENFQQ